MTNVTYPNPSSYQQQQQPPQQVQQIPQHTVLTPQYYTVNTPLIERPHNKGDKHASDRAYSVTFFVLGFFFFFPFFFNFAYLKSPHCYARKISLASLIVGTLYLCAAVSVTSSFYFGMRCWNGYYYDFC
ncbi:hypothetical protein DICPUDRAFT_155357 [Dictyostelium purpureum]|uniref:Uncharacterized protein n=1 Tax=Dictyostelium purpureum TaxID=5786 RepID=F0ZTS5_DICPU|nr:uncharacterized protein DICPUDRAFT_155357 [Dictyostelium purpureum]EGC32658.1 hypothetical protein DICPUDRAFT_155357 [Dictyostelium purpureum]|eukprot:XP_003290827.1 hypothetical protein DICPUDRAFT_155357 [Dictyostelium purpureum]